MAALEHDPEKWMPVFRTDHAPAKSMIRKSGCRFSEKIMLHQRVIGKVDAGFPKRSCSGKEHESDDEST
jgi:hypothetical protein